MARSEGLVLEMGHATDAHGNEREREEVRASWAVSNDVQRWCGVLLLLMVLDGVEGVLSKDLSR
jgi:hypothetical protein